MEKKEETVSTEYPKWLYHKSKDKVLVNSKEEHEDLGKGWEESPAAFKADENKKEEDNSGGFADMKVPELKDVLMEKGLTEEELKGMKKPELVALCEEMAAE